MNLGFSLIGYGGIFYLFKRLEYVYLIFIKLCDDDNFNGI